MDYSNGNNKIDSSTVEVQGELTYRLIWLPFRVLSVITGLFLLRGFLTIFLRFCLAFRRRAVLTVKDSSLVVNVKWSILGKELHKTTTQTPILDIKAVQFENRRQYLYLLFGWGFFAVGVWVGIQWFVDGLRAGYPYLALVGAGVVLAGILIDFGLYFFIPQGKGRSRLLVAMGPWKMRVAGVDKVAASELFDDVRRSWQAATVERR